MWKIICISVFLLTEGLLAAGGPIVTQATENPYEVILVGNNNSGTISVIDTRDFKVACEINVRPDAAERAKEMGIIQRLVNWYADYAYADDIELSLDAKTIYASRASYSDVAAFEFPSGKMRWRVPIKGYRADHIRLNSSGDLLYASAVTAGEVQVIDTHTHQIIGSFPTGSRPHGIEFSPNGEQVFVGELKGNGITVADTKSMRVMKHIGFETGVRPFVMTKDGRSLYLQLSNFHGFLEYDLVDNRLLKRIYLPETEKSNTYHGKYPKDAAHHGISLSLDERYLCVAETVSDYVAIVSRPSLKVEALVPVGANPAWVIQSLDGKYCYASSRVANTISVISYDTLKEVHRIPVGDYPLRMVTARVKQPCPNP